MLKNLRSFVFLLVIGRQSFSKAPLTEGTATIGEWRNVCRKRDELKNHNTNGDYSKKVERFLKIVERVMEKC